MNIARSDFSESVAPVRGPEPVVGRFRSHAGGLPPHRGGSAPTEGQRALDRGERIWEGTGGAVDP